MESCTPEGLATCSLRNKFAMGDTLEAVGPDLRPFAFAVGEMFDADGAALTEPKTPQMRFTLRLPKAVPPYSILRHSVALSAK